MIYVIHTVKIIQTTHHIANKTSNSNSARRFTNIYDILKIRKFLSIENKKNQNSSYKRSINRNRSIITGDMATEVKTMLKHKVKFTQKNGEKRRKFEPQI